jgi:hypothetical protein
MRCGRNISSVTEELITGEKAESAELGTSYRGKDPD